MAVGITKIGELDTENEVREECKQIFRPDIVYFIYECTDDFEDILSRRGVMNILYDFMHNEETAIVNFETSHTCRDYTSYYKGIACYRKGIGELPKELMDANYFTQFMYADNGMNCAAYKLNDGNHNILLCNAIEMPSVINITTRAYEIESCTIPTKWLEQGEVMGLGEGIYSPQFRIMSNTGVEIATIRDLFILVLDAIKYRVCKGELEDYMVNEDLFWQFNGGTSSPANMRRCEKTCLYEFNCSASLVQKKNPDFTVLSLGHIVCTFYTRPTSNGITKEFVCAIKCDQTFDKNPFKSAVIFKFEYEITPLGETAWYCTKVTQDIDGLYEADL